MAKILIVEDDPGIAFGLEESLRHEGHSGEVVADGEMASRRSCEPGWELILLDVTLPRKDGYEICRELRAAGRRTPILMLSGRALESEKVKGLALGADDYLTKPFSTRELNARIEALLRRASPEPEKSAGEVELDSAREIQQALIPRHIPQPPGTRVAGSYRPARTVGGDYFDVIELGEDCFTLIIADVSGKGLPAALLMANVQAAVRALAPRLKSPKELCRSVNRVLRSHLSPGKFVTFFCGVIDASRRRLVYSNAGHNPPLVCRRGQVARLETGGPVLGVIDAPGYDEAGLTLEAGDRLLLYTDGLSEAMNASGEEFGDGRLGEILRSSDAAGAGQLIEEIMDAVTGFCGNHLHDDAAMIAVTVGTA